MIKETLPLLLALFASCQATQDPAEKARHDESLDRAQQLLEGQELDEALTITDGVLREDPENRRARLLAANGNLALFESGREGSQYFLVDAISNFQQALDLDQRDPESWIKLSYCYLKNSEFDAGRDAGIKAAEILQAEGAENEKIAQALISAADNEMQIFADARRVELAAEERPSDDTEDLARQTLSTLGLAFQAGAVGPATVKTAQVYQWLSQEKRALDTLERGILAEPANNQIQAAFQTLYFNLDQRLECVAAYKRLLKQRPDSTAMIWYMGRALVSLGDDYRSKTQYEAAKRSYFDARESYRDYDRRRPVDGATTNQWIAICELALGRIAYEQGELGEATAHYEAAFEASPLVAESGEDGLPKLYDSFGGNYIGGLSLIGKAISEGEGADALRRSLEFYEKIIERHPDKFGTIYNNAALSARDLGATIAGTGGAATEASEDPAHKERLRQAMELWEKSYAYYVVAVELEPEDPRIVNDCGLMLIYHLHREHERARELFDRAIELGEAQLAELDAGASEDQRNFFEEAVGDAYQNIGVLMEQENRPADEYRPFLEKAVEFYPYQMRQAAAMLRRLERDRGRGQTARDPRKARFDRDIVRAREQAAEADFDAALLTLDRMGGEMSGYAPYHYHVGLYSLRYADAAREQGGGVALVDGLYNDARNNLTKAVELDGEPVEPRVELCRALSAVGDFEAAAREASRVLSHIRAFGAGVDPQVFVDIHAVRARAAVRVYVASVQAGAADEEVLRDARTSFRLLERSEALDESSRTLWVNLEQWAGGKEAAVQILVRALERAPDDQQVLTQLVEVGASLGMSALVVEALGDHSDATGLWYRGRAQFSLAQDQWAKGEPETAVETLDRARASFRASMDANLEFADSSKQWMALCLGSRGLVQISAEQFDAAERSLLDALLTNPEVLESDLGGGSTVKRGILIVGDRYYKADDLASLQRLYAAASTAAPDDIDLANNEGLFARDYGSEIEKTEPSRAAELFEASYEAYTRASRLDPDNIRLRNDRALLLIYHLDRELDAAVELLQGAIADGSRRLAEDSPTDPNELRDLQESVGDAYGNLGYYYMNKVRDYPKARQNIEKSLEFYPFEERAGTRQLERLAELEKDKGRPR